jgi:N-(2-amino-2-carboxyethyl)-L-glutamate synthase
MNLLNRIKQVEPLIGNTPVQKLDIIDLNIFAKLEYYQFTESIKVRPAYYILKNAILNNLINENTQVIESSSGNFGIALASLCSMLGIKFIPVIDANTTPGKEKILRLLSHNVIKITERDATGGYLLNRIKTVKEHQQNYPNSFNPNQYENPENYLSYYNGMGKEICKQFDKLDYVFISVSSGGTIAGLSRRLKEKFKDIKIVAVDVEGSLIFTNQSKARHVGGLGSSLRTPTIDKAVIDEVVILSEREIVSGCRELLKEQMIFGGASSGAAYYAAKKTMRKLADASLNSLFICPDHGSSYIDTVYDDVWTEENIFRTEEILETI